MLSSSKCLTLFLFTSSHSNIHFKQTNVSASWCNMSTAGNCSSIWVVIGYSPRNGLDFTVQRSFQHSGEQLTVFYFYDLFTPLTFFPHLIARLLRATIRFNLITSLYAALDWRPAGCTPIDNVGPISRRGAWRVHSPPFSHLQTILLFASRCV